MSKTEKTDADRKRNSSLPLAVAALLAAFAVLTITSSWDKSPTFDEGFYISGGYGYLKTGDPTMAGWFHPVLAPVVSALPLMTLDLEDPTRIMGWNRELLIYAPMFLNYNKTDARTIVRLSRLATLPIGLLLGLGVFLWSRKLFGNAAGLLSLFLFVLAPNIIAHSRLATTDLLLSATVFWATFLFHEHLRRPRVLLAVGAGVLAGAAMLTKVSALLMFPGWTVLTIIYFLKPAERKQEPSEHTPLLLRLYDRFGSRLCVLLCSVLVMAVMATVTIGAAYRFRYAGARSAEKTAVGTTVETTEDEHSFHAWSLGVFERARKYTPLPSSYLHTVRVFLDKARDGHPGFLFGEVGGPWWNYFPVAYALKTPLGTIALTALALALLSASVRPRWGLELMVVPIIFFAGCMTSSINIGYRHVLPIVPFLLVLVGSLATVRFRGVRVLHAAVAVMVAWTAFSSLTIYPDYLAYFNELAGGPAGGARYMGDSNLDWGQDVGTLAKYVKTNGITEPVNVFLHTMTPAEKLGFETVNGFRQREPKPGWYALSPTVMQGIYEQESPQLAERFEWLLRFKPTAVFGRTIRIYHISEDDLRRVRKTDGTDGT